jgi:catechol 2,3-dioxygenase
MWFAFEAQDGATFNTVRERLQAAGVSMASVANGVEVSDPWGTRVRLLPA